MKAFDRFPQLRLCGLVVLLVIALSRLWSQTAPADTNHVNALIDEALTYSYTIPDSTILLTDSALGLAYVLKHDFGKMKCLSLLGMMYTGNSEFSRARDTLQKGLAIAKKINSKRGIATTSGRLGLVYQQMGYYREALKFHRVAVKLYEEQGTKNGIPVAYNNIAIVYNYLGDSAAAMHSYRKALAHAEAIGKTRLIIKTNTNISYLYNKRRLLDSALVYQQKALDTAQAHGFLLEEAHVRSAISQTMRLKKQFNSAMHELEQVMPIFQKLNIPYRVAATHVYMGHIKLLQNRPRSAVTDLQEAVRIAEDINAQEIKKSALFHLSDAYQRTGRTQAALDAFRAYHDIESQLENEEIRAELEQVKTKFQVERKDKELAQLTLRLEQERFAYEEQQITLAKRELELNRSRNRAGLFVGLGIGLALIVVFLLVKFRDNRRHTALLQDKQALTATSLAEKEMLLDEIHHRVKNNLQLVFNMLDLQSRSLADQNAQKALKDSMHRVSTMALLHQKLYQEDLVGGVRMPDYVDQLLHSLYLSYRDQEHEVAVEVDVQDMVLDIDTTIPLGLIINELVTNSFKYAFRDRVSGHLRVGLHQGEGNLLLEVRDNGPGMPEAALKKGNFGMRMVRSLARQVKAQMEVQNDRGTTVRLRIGKYKLLSG
ncbi:MAG: tetratricopeptide repeat protein [Bacteroidota bacterium]